MGLRLLLQRLLRKRELRLRWWLWQGRRRSPAKSRSGAAAGIAAARVNRPREMIGKPQPPRSHHDKQFGILQGFAF